MERTWMGRAWRGPWMWMVVVAGLAGVAAVVALGASDEVRPLGASVPEGNGAGGDEPTLEQVRAATERFRDVEVALAEGYVRDPLDLCDTAEMMGRPAEHGVMGIHFFRPDLLGVSGPPDPRVRGTGTHTDFLRPGILIYEPQADGSLALVAVENLVFRDAWEAAGHSERPTFRGVPYDLMEDDPSTPLDEAHLFEPHYDLHMWLYRENPRGLYAQFNPNATCAHHTGGSGHAHGG